MDIPEKLENLLESAVESFGEMDEVRIVSHYDADGISAASIILATCLREGKRVHLSVVKQLRPEVVEKLNDQEPRNLIFTDMGSGHLSLINDVDSENILVLDHHQLSGELEEGIHVNPHLAGMKEDSVSGAGMTYLFARELSEDNRDLSPMAVVGAIGDIQEEKWEMKGLNEEILEEAEEGGYLQRRKGLRLFGRLSRPIHKSLEYTTRPYIPGISENESGAVQFLSELDIGLKEDGSWKKLSDLIEEEKKKLASAIIKERINGGVDEAEEIFGNVYTLNSFDGRFKDARELSTAMNACGRMSQASVGILACLEEEKSREKLEEIVDGYKKTIGKLVTKVREDEEMVDHREGLTVIDGIGEIPENFVGTVCSILHTTLAEGEVLAGLAESENDEIKISVRVPDSMEVNVGDMVSEIADNLGGEGGGHEKAGGAYIPSKEVENFLEDLKSSLEERKVI